jgi:hypothetical protein
LKCDTRGDLEVALAAAVDAEQSAASGGKAAVSAASVRTQLIQAVLKIRA